jgi:hypothetical protein
MQLKFIDNFASKSVKKPHPALSKEEGSKTVEMRYLYTLISAFYNAAWLS